MYFKSSYCFQKEYVLTCYSRSEEGLNSNATPLHHGLQDHDSIESGKLLCLTQVISVPTNLRKESNNFSIIDLLPSFVNVLEQQYVFYQTINICFPLHHWKNYLTEYLAQNNNSNVTNTQNPDLKAVLSLTARSKLVDRVLTLNQQQEMTTLKLKDLRSASSLWIKNAARNLDSVDHDSMRRYRLFQEGMLTTTRANKRNKRNQKAHFIPNFSGLNYEINAFLEDDHVRFFDLDDKDRQVEILLRLKQFLLEYGDLIGFSLTNFHPVYFVIYDVNTTTKASKEKYEMVASPDSQDLQILRIPHNFKFSELLRFIQARLSVAQLDLFS